MQFEKTLAFEIPMCLTEYAKRTKAPHDAKRANSRIGRNELRLWAELMKLLKSKIRNTGRKRIDPMTFCTFTI
jgi:hypothetical protein